MSNKAENRKGGERMHKRIFICVLCLLLVLMDNNLVKASEADMQDYEIQTEAASYNPYVDTRYVYLSGYIYVNVVMPDGSLSIYKVDCSVPYNDYAGSQQIIYAIQLVNGMDLGATLKESAYYTCSDGMEKVYTQFQESSRQYVFPFSIKFNRIIPGYHIELVGVIGNENDISSMTGYGADWVSFVTDTNDNGMTNYIDDMEFRHATYVVQYVPNKYTLTLESNGGTYNSMAWNVSFPLTYATGDYNRIGCPQRTGYLFDGWFDVNGTQIYDSNGDALPCIYWSNYGEYGYYQYQGDLTVHANWTPITYYVSYKGNGNTGGYTATSMHTYDVEKALNSNGYVKTGYVFAGWNTRADGKGTAYSNNALVNNLMSTHESTVTLYAQWKPIAYKISYDGNGSTEGTTKSSSHTYDSSSKLTANGFTRAGYTFVGWNTKADGSGITYNDKDSISNLTNVNGQTVTLYAQWQLNPITVSIPRKLILNQDGEGSFVIKADNETGVITVNTDDTISLMQNGKQQISNGTVLLEDNTLTKDRHKIKGNICVDNITAGTWKGIINLNITFKL